MTPIGHRAWETLLEDSAFSRNKLFNGLRQMLPGTKPRDLVIFAFNIANYAVPHRSNGIGREHGSDRFSHAWVNGDCKTRLQMAGTNGY